MHTYLLKCGELRTHTTLFRLAERWKGIGKRLECYRSGRSLCLDDLNRLDAKIDSFDQDISDLAERHHWPELETLMNKRFLWLKERCFILEQIGQQLSEVQSSQAKKSQYFKRLAKVYGQLEVFRTGTHASDACALQTKMEVNTFILEMPSEKYLLENLLSIRQRYLQK